MDLRLGFHSSRALGWASAEMSVVLVWVAVIVVGVGCLGAVGGCVGLLVEARGGVGGRKYRRSAGWGGLMVGSDVCDTWAGAYAEVDVYTVVPGGRRSTGYPSRGPFASRARSSGVGRSGYSVQGSCWEEAKSMEARWDISGKWCRVSWYVWMVGVLMRCR